MPRSTASYCIFCPSNLIVNSAAILCNPLSPEKSQCRRFMGLGFIRLLIASRKKTKLNESACHPLDDTARDDTYLIGTNNKTAQDSINSIFAFHSIIMRLPMTQSNKRT